MCVLPSDIPFRSDEIPPLETMLTNEQFAKIAPSVVTELIRFLLICENVPGDHINASTVLHTLTCFLIAISKCSIECLPSLSRLAEFLAQQANGRQDRVKNDDRVFLEKQISTNIFSPIY